MKTRSPILCAGLLTWSASAFAASAALTPESLEFFENKIRPVLAAECYECHNAKKAKGGLRLDYRAGWQKGGDTGDAIVPGDPKRSLLIESIKHTDPDLKMPDKAPKLDEVVIADFEKWVAMGAPDPRDEPPTEQASKPTWADLLATRRTWWSLQPVKKPTPPAVKNTAWAENPVDSFLLAKMEAKDLVPAAPADPRTFIRRLTFTLTGLPPTPQEVEMFVAAMINDQTSAILQLTDRLLASPRFGEHWARHWMDLMRFAETHGSEGDPEIREAWRYRDYLIRAFNADVPADQLIREHLAGDLLAHPRINPEGLNESILGTAQFRLVEHGFQPIDTLDDQVRAVDNQIDVVTKAFQGFTVSCARCHDHKFDAISQRDWTAMYGIFASIRPAQVTIDTPEVLGRNRPELERLHARIKTALVEAWQATAQSLGQRLQATRLAAAQAEDTAARVRILEQKVADLEWSARQTIQPTPVSERPANGAPAPFASWTFDKDASDSRGQVDGHLEGNAEIKNGRLRLDGQGAHLRTDPLPIPMPAKTLEAWVSPANLHQRGGGVITVETTKTHGFDAIVYAEKEANRWVAGSNHFIRSQILDGPLETAAPGELVHVAVSYQADGTIAMYRNGLPYGVPYTMGEPLAFGPGEAQVLLGWRHKGASNGYFAGEIEEARLYDRALTALEIAASFRAGPGEMMAAEQIIAALTPAQRKERSLLKDEIERLRKTSGENGTSGAAWTAALKDAANDAANPLHLWAKLGQVQDADFPAAWRALSAALRTRSVDAQRFNRENFRPAWNLAGDDYKNWFPYGPGLSKQPRQAGGFTVETEGETVIGGLAPAGAFTATLSSKHGGLLTSPRFKIDSDSISVRAAGGGGAMVRVIVDNYPLPSNPIFAKAVLNNDDAGWVRLDTAYRKGSMAYLEFGTREDLTRPIDDKPKDKTKEVAKLRDGRSFFSAEEVVFHDSKEPPRERALALLPLLEATRSGAAEISSDDETRSGAERAELQSATQLADHYQRVIAEAVNAWRDDALTEPQRALLDSLVRRGVLPVTLKELPQLQPLVAEYRNFEADVPVPQRAPGVLETVAYDAPFLPRGDHLKPEATVPRGFLEVINPKPYSTTLSGRLELAHDITNPQNPLTARVTVNRIWHWLFGRGLVPTVDNFGRLGEKPTHPELLDFLAARFVEQGWSIKDTIRFLINTRAYQMSSMPMAGASEIDPTNELLSHFRVQRLEAESIRDALLAVSGQLQSKMGGKSEIETPRRSIYLKVQRTNLQPFLQVFDAPKPFTTLGRRDSTNVPAQSLTLLNSPFVIDQSRRWAGALMDGGEDSVESRISRMFAAAFARPPGDDELDAATVYLTALGHDRAVPIGQLLKSQPVWQDFAQSLFNLKEFIYLR
jgi:hypothetical protein